MPKTRHRRPASSSHLPVAPPAAFRAGDRVVATFDPRRVGVVSRMRTSVDVVVQWADSLVSEVPTSFLRLAEGA